MPTIKAIHQLIIPGLKDKDPQRKILPGEVAEVSDEVAEDLINREAAVKVTKAEAKAIENGTVDDNPPPVEETEAQKKAREKAEKDEADRIAAEKKAADNGSDLV